MTVKELDELYDTARLLIDHGRYALIDDLLEYYSNAAWRMNVNDLLGWATVTLPVKSKLSKRARFIESCIKFHNDEPNLWKGLE